MKTAITSQSVLPAGICRGNYTREQIEQILPPEQVTRFWRWMDGQTQSICDGYRYNHEKDEYEPTECVQHPHGPVVYAWDFERFCAGLPPLD